MTDRFALVLATRAIVSAAVGGLAACTVGASSASAAPHVLSHRTATITSGQPRGALSCATMPCAYVANNASSGGGASVTAYVATSDGNFAPITTIKGPKTGLNQPNGIALDSNGNVYVANGGDQSITVYAAGSKGDVAPIQTIKGSNTGLLFVEGIAVDTGRNIYVATFGYFPIVVGYVLVFGAGADGNVAPMRAISGPNTGLSWPQGIALDGGGNIYVANDRGCIPNYGCSGTNSVTTYPPNANGNVQPQRVIEGKNTALKAPFGLTLDTRGRLYVVNYNSRRHSESVTVYPPYADGNVAPLAMIRGSKTGLDHPWGIALDASDNMYVTNGINSVTVYAPGADGNVAPIRTISGAHTALNYPQGIAVH